MTTQRSRRKTPPRKSAQQPARKRRPVKPAIDWKSGLMKFLIGLLLILDIVLILFIIKQCAKPVVEIEEEPIPVVTRRLQIEVLNGCGAPGVASGFTDFLRDEGYDVVKTDNYESFNVQRSVVIDRRGNLENGVRIAKSMGLNEDRVLQEVNEAYLIDASVIIGNDYRTLPCWQTMER